MPDRDLRTGFLLGSRLIPTDTLARVLKVFELAIILHFM